MTKERKSFSSIFHNVYTAWIILILSLAITVVAWYISANFSKQLAEDRFDSRSGEIVTAIEDRMSLYEQALWGGLALFNASDSVSRDDWFSYVSTLDIQNKLPGIQGMGYAIPLNELRKDSLITQLQSNGFPEFDVKPEGIRDIYSAIIYLEPFDWRNQRAFGFDMWSNEIRRDAMQRSISENKAATSGIITLMQETDEDVQKGFLTYLPVFDKANPMNYAKEPFKGWVYAAFRAGDLMKGILGETKGYEIELYDDGLKTKDNLLYSSDGELKLLDNTRKEEYVKEIPMSIQGRDWLLYVRSNEQFIQVKDTLIPKMIAVGGLIIDILLFLVILSISRTQKKAEAAVNERTAELNLERLVLKKRNEELSEFAYITSHDLQEPLRTIRSFISLLEEKNAEKLDEESKKYLSIIANSSERMSDLIIAILNYSRIGASSTLESVDANEVVQDVLQDLHSFVERTNTKIEIENLPLLQAYKSEFHLLLQNLFTNAFKFQKEGVDPEIKVSFTEDTTHYIFSVEDNGIGIEEKYLERIFKIFQRLHTRTEYEGTGIGLAHCRKIALLHKGEIWAESELGVGSKFYFSIEKL